MPRSLPSPVVSPGSCVRGRAQLAALALAALGAACAPKVTDTSGNYASSKVDVRVVDLDVQSDPAQPSLLSVTVTAAHAFEVLDVDVRIYLSAPGAPLQPIETLDTTQTSIPDGGSITRSVRTDTAQSPPGSYVLACSVAPTAPLADPDPADNVASWAAPLTIGGAVRPDLRGSSNLPSTVTPTNLAGPGSPLQVSGTVLNDGPGACASFRIGVYASTDATISTSDTLLGYVDMQPLGSFATATFQATVSTGNLLPSSVYEIGWIADPDGVITEGFEGNNAQLVANGPIAVSNVTRPDLETTSDGASLSTYNLAGPGSPLSATCVVRNAGNAATGAYTVAFYASSDVTITTGDLLLGTTTAPSLAPGASFTLTLASASTASLLGGQSYHVGWIADPANALVEYSETNNTARLPNQLAVGAPTSFPDLSTQTLNSSFTPTTIASPGLPVSVTCEVRNLGTATSPATTVNFYASADTTISTSDALLGSRPLGALAPGATTTCVLSNGATTSLATGQAWHIGWIVDPSGTVTESNESNNRATAAGQFVVGSVVPTLANGVAVPFTVAANGTLPYRIQLPTGVLQMSVEITGTGDADLYVKRLPIVWPADQGAHNEPEFQAPYLNGSNESVTFFSPASGTWNVLLHGYPTAATSSGTLRATWSASNSTTTSFVRETPHPYANSATYSFTYSAPGATQVGVHFTQLTTELDYDYLYVRNSQGSIVYAVSGNLISGGVATATGPVFGRNDGWCLVSGSSITIELATDTSVVAYGYLTDLAFAAY